jgi:O-antigen biosynthesis protein WbqP
MPLKGFLRFLDLLIAAVALVILFPVMLLLTLVGYFDTGSPVFRQTRVGYQERPFDLLKFRSMKLDTASVDFSGAPSLMSCLNLLMS